MGGSFDLNSFQRNHTDPVLISGINMGELNPPLNDNFQNTWEQDPSRDTIHTISVEESRGTLDVKEIITHRGGGK